MRKNLTVFAVIGVIVGWVSAHQSYAQNYDPGYPDGLACDAAAKSAAQASGVPVLVLQAIARAESGLTVEGVFLPWPWTVNVEGQGKYFNTKEDASKFVEHKLQSGVQNVDVGCFQINFKWHGTHFKNAEQLLDPQANAHYAAKFLKKLHEELGSWQAAVGAYHSRTTELADRYRARLTPIVKNLTSRNATSDAIIALETQNDFQLLRGRSDSAGSGSLFPQSNRVNRSWFANLDRRG